MPVLSLAGRYETVKKISPQQRLKMQVHRVDQTLLPPSCIASLACVCMMAACPLQNESMINHKTDSRSFTSVQMFHTHTLLTHTQLTHTHTTYLHTTFLHTTYSHTTYSHTTYTHTQLTHTLLIYPQLSYTQLTLTQLTHTPLTHTQPTHTQLNLTQVTRTQLTHTHTHHLPTHHLLTHHLLTQLIHTPLYYKECAQHLPVLRNWSSTAGSRRNCQKKSSKTLSQP